MEVEQSVQGLMGLLGVWESPAGQGGPVAMREFELGNIG
jgi:hypothetical protein